MSPFDQFVHRATVEEIDRAFALVSEYYEEARVVAREDREQFEKQYFAEGSGIWLAFADEAATGCVALRRLATRANCGEIKRMYVRPSERRKGIAASLLRALERFAAEQNYAWLYLDTTDSMVAAARFYERNGYTQCERYNDNPQATLFMRKRIAQT